ncbi:MAG: hypothetical protein A2176_04575 [Spirochaetes bacterium RBG_13_51_14]|nr:MAG: hypothetical protein A2176_04575 [Spirochaetes bacterium RBG_13_51_14]
MKSIRRIIIIILLMAMQPGLDGAGWWRLYFTSPGNRGIVSNRTNPQTGLVSIINKAERYIYGAFYEVSSPRVVSALCAARTRGVDVKIVTEQNTMRKRGRVMGQFERAGVDVVTDNRRGLMHNKFAVIDGRYLWTGSYNPTVNDSEKNNNNAILIYSSLLAGIYRNEFMEMFEDRIFGNRREAGPFADLRNRYYVKIDDTGINVYFSPEDNVERIILMRLAKAKSTIHFMAFSFTSDGIGEMMIKKFKQGVQVYGIFERRGANGGHSEYVKMKLEGLPVKLDRNRNAMHHKVIIIDGVRVITGSYNFSRNAKNVNDENILIIDNREIAAEYLEEFKRLYR